jgi:prevent-host-death family protein
MRLHEAIKPISYVETHAAEVLRDVVETGNSLVITQNGEAKAILMDVREYDAMRESLAMMKILAVSSREVQQGRIRNADKVLAGLAAKLKSKRNAEN